MIIRKPIVEDVPYLEILFQVTCKHTFTNEHSEKFKIGDYQKSIVDDDVWIAEENGVIMGFVSIYSEDNFLHNLFVHPDHQGKNIGTQLLKFAEAQLSHPMILKVSMDNLTVCGFYEKHGWRQVSRHKDADESYISYKKE